MILFMLPERCMSNFLNLVCIVSEFKNTNVLWHQEAVMVIQKDNSYWYITRFSSWKVLVKTK